MSASIFGPIESVPKMPAPAAAVKPGSGPNSVSGHTTKLNNGKSNTDSRTNLTANTPTACQRLRYDIFAVALPEVLTRPMDDTGTGSRFDFVVFTHYAMGVGVREAGVIGSIANL